jgi:predicted Zn-dependent protease
MHPTRAFDADPDRPRPAPRRALRAWLAAAMSVLLAVQPVVRAQELPTLGEAGAEDLSPREERQYGEEIMQEYFRRSLQYLDDPETAEYINSLGYQLVAVSAARSTDFEFFVLRDPTFNAFALPGGFIGIHTATILMAQSESELASVMAHEIGHVQQRHIARSLARQRDSALITLGSVLAALVAARAGQGQGAQAALMVGQAAAISRQLAFTRENEREADRVGFQILTEAGFDPQGMVDMFTLMHQGTRAYASLAPAYLRTHPMDEERIADLMGRVQATHTHQHADSLDFQLVRARLHVLQDESTQGLRDSLASFSDQLAHHTLASDTAAWYGAALADIKLKRFGPALEAAQAARRSSNVPSAMLEDIVNLARYEAAGNDAEREAALAASRDTAARFPLSRSVAMQYTDILQRSQHHDRAVAYLREQLALSHSDPDFYNFLSISYAALDKRTLQHQATAEMYLLLGSPPAALEQLQLARKVADADFYTMTEVDARLRQIAEMVREQQEEARNGAR